MRTRPTAPSGRQSPVDVVLLAVCAFLLVGVMFELAAKLLPAAVTDRVGILWATASAVLLALVPVVVQEVLEARRATPVPAPRRRRARVIQAVGAAVLLAATLLVPPVGPALAWPEPRVPPPDGCPESPYVTAAGGGSQDCYGVIGLPGDPAPQSDAATFGRDDRLRAVQRRILGANAVLPADAPTLVWLGELTCATYDPQSDQCTTPDGKPTHVNDSEYEELQALRVAQAAKGLRVVIANAGELDARVEEVTARLRDLDAEGRLGTHRAVVGGGNSTTKLQRSTRQNLLAAGIPFIAPTLLADKGAPGRPFIDEPGYLQLSPANDVYARYAIEGLARTFPQGVNLRIFRQPSTTDLYTDSLVDDLQFWAARAGIETTVLAPSAVSDLTREVAQLCQGQTDSDGRPTAAYFADRYFRFADFVSRINTLCGGRPTLVMANTSAARMLDSPRGTLFKERWPIFYNTGGRQCSSLDPDSNLAQRLRLPVAQGGLGDPCGTGGQISDRTVTFWDAATLALALFESAPTRTTDAGALRTLQADVMLVHGRASVADGVLRTPVIPVIAVCASPSGGPRTLNQCVDGRPTGAGGTAVDTFKGFHAGREVFFDAAPPPAPQPWGSSRATA